MKSAFAYTAVALLLLSLAIVAAGALSSSLRAEPGPCVTANGHTSDAQPNLPLSLGGASSDLWNVKTAGGFNQMCYDPRSGLATTVDLTNITVRSGTSQVIAYPHAGYGYGEFDTSFGRQGQGASFPMAMATFDKVGILSSVNYSLSIPPGQSMDFAYDLWIEAAPQAGSKASLTDLEVMVWLYNQTMQPAQTFRGTIATAVTIDGTNTNATWMVFATPSSSCCRELVTYLLDPTMARGSISLQLRDMVDDAMGHYWQPVPGLTYHLMGVELGTEFEATAGSGTFSWTVSSMEIEEAGYSTLKIVL